MCSTENKCPSFGIFSKETSGSHQIKVKKDSAFSVLAITNYIVKNNLKIFHLLKQQNYLHLAPCSIIVIQVTHKKQSPQNKTSISSLGNDWLQFKTLEMLNTVFSISAVTKSLTPNTF